MFSLPPSQAFHDLSFQKELFFRLIKKFPPNEFHRIETAYTMAEKAHAIQMRDDGTPYIIHPLRAAISLINECGITNSDTVCAILLHDTIEDTTLTRDEIKKIFGAHVAQLVSNVTRPRLVHQTEEFVRKDKIEKFTWLLSADEQTRLIKCADLLDNVRSWPHIPPLSPSCKKFPRWFEEVATYGLPLAQKTNDALFHELKRAYDFSKETITHNTCTASTER